MDWKKVLLSALKFGGATLGAVVIAALTVALTGYKPGNPLEIVAWQYIVAPLLAAIIGGIQNYLKHMND